MQSTDLALARQEIARALLDLDDIRRRATALVASTTWRARAVDAYRAAAEEWVAGIDRGQDRVARLDSDLAAAERAARIRESGALS